MTPLVELRAAWKRYGEGAVALDALRGIDLRIARGEFVAMTGPSGSGKSTTLNLIGCLDRLSSGAYLFDGVRVDGLNEEDLAHLRRRYVGFVFQSFNLLRRADALTNVALPLLYRGVSGAERREQARRALEQVGLAQWARHRPAQLSGGQQQRVAIARALVTNPDLLLADEPTGNLDSERAREIMQLLGRLNAQLGVTIVMVTHQPEMAAFAGRVIRFADGQIAARAEAVA